MHLPARTALAALTVLLSGVAGACSPAANAQAADDQPVVTQPVDLQGDNKAAVETQSAPVAQTQADALPPEPQPTEPLPGDAQPVDAQAADTQAFQTAPADAAPADALSADLQAVLRPPADANAADANPSDADQTAAPSPIAAQFAQWVAASGDNAGLPFAIVDKLGAQVSVYDASGQLLGAAPALVGLAPGDDSAPGIGERAMSKIHPDERTTPAGRFVAGYGPSRRGEVLWVDYGDAISMHPVVTTNPKEHRLERIQSAAPEDRRISYGCINVPAAFYSAIVRPTFTGTKGVVYILPDSKPVEDVFPGFAGRRAGRASTDSARAALEVGAPADSRAADPGASTDSATAADRPNPDGPTVLTTGSDPADGQANPRPSTEVGSNQEQ